MRFQIYQQIRYEHLLLRYDEIYTMSDKTPYIIGRHCTQYKYYRALGFSLNQFFCFRICPGVYAELSALYRRTTSCPNKLAVQNV